MMKNLKNDKGIVVADALIAILIMTIFLGLMITLTYNIYLTANFTKRNSTAVNYGINIMEHIERTDYNNVTEDKLIDYIETLGNNVSAGTDGNTLTTPYKVVLDVQNYNETLGNEGKQDVIKKITVTIKYNLGDSEKEVKFEKIKTSI